MQSLSQSRMFHRVLLLALIVAFMIIASWRFAPAYHSGLSFAGLDPFVSDASSRTNASMDTQIQMLQDQLRSHPDDWQAYSQLGLVYLQKARETGDPTYYQKTEEALDRALSFNPDEYASVSAKGALALARHDFVSALEWGERAKQINPDRSYAYGVIADAQSSWDAMPKPSRLCRQWSICARISVPIHEFPIFENCTGTWMERWN
ncbi:MAG: hypothetical protein EHM40_18680 [Chloroflexi bacterium]|nr:MAG: hypothetical protein EHM40_18680 [Chloroflexota bacterium]